MYPESGSLTTLPGMKPIAAKNLGGFNFFPVPQVLLLLYRDGNTLLLDKYAAWLPTAHIAPTQGAENIGSFKKTSEDQGKERNLHVLLYARYSNNQQSL